MLARCEALWALRPRAPAFLEESLNGRRFARRISSGLCAGWLVLRSELITEPRFGNFRQNHNTIKS